MPSTKLSCDIIAKTNEGFAMETVGAALIREAINVYGNEELKANVAILTDDQLLKVSDEITGSTITFYKNLVILSDEVTKLAIQNRLYGQEKSSLVSQIVQ